MLNFHKIIRDIQVGLNKSWLKSGLSNFTLLGNYLKRSKSQGATPNYYDFMNAYLNSSPYFCRWFKSYIKDAALQSEFEDVIMMFNFMKVNNIFNENVFNQLIERAQPENISIASWGSMFERVFITLKNAHILTDENFMAVVLHPNLGTLEMVINNLNYGHILTQDNFTAIARKANPDSMGRALITLNEANLLSEDHLTTLADHENPWDMAKGLVVLRNAYMLTQEHITTIAGHEDPWNFAKGLVTLKRDQILKPEYITAIANHPQPDNPAQALVILKKAHILTQNNINACVGEPYSIDIAKAFVSLNEAHMLNDANRAALVGLPLYQSMDTPQLHIAVPMLKSSDLLTQDYFNAISLHSDPFGLAQAFILLKQANLLNLRDVIFNAVNQHSKPQDFARALCLLKNAGLLNQDNLRILAEHLYVQEFSKALTALSNINILNQDNFNYVLKHRNQREFWNALSLMDDAGMLTVNIFKYLSNIDDPYRQAYKLGLLEEKKVGRYLMKVDRLLSTTSPLCENGFFLDDRRSKEALRLIDSYNTKFPEENGVISALTL